MSSQTESMAALPRAPAAMRTVDRACSDTSRYTPESKRDAWPPQRRSEVFGSPHQPGDRGVGCDRANFEDAAGRLTQCDHVEAVEGVDLGLALGHGQHHRAIARPLHSLKICAELRSSDRIHSHDDSLAVQRAIKKHLSGVRFAVWCDSVLEVDDDRVGCG